MKAFGLFGEKLSHSLSPAIHNMIYQTIGLQAAYSLYEIQPHMLASAVQGIKALGINGVNVTIPYKLKVMESLDGISKEALSIGAVNTIHNIENKLYGYNTDYIGFGRMLNRNSIVVKNKSAVVLGTGGASKAVIAYLTDNGIADINIVSRKPEEVKTYDKDMYKLIDYNQLKQLKQTDMLINCTPCGMHPKIDCSPIEETLIPRFGALVDLIYNPSETLLMKYADKYGIANMNGLYMLVEQAIAAVEIWIEETIDSTVVSRIYQRLQQSK